MRPKSVGRDAGRAGGRSSMGGLILGLVALVVQACLLGGTLRAQEQHTQWQADVRKYAEAREWDAAMKIVDREAARAPEDMDVRAWRARVLTWSGHLADA